MSSFVVDLFPTDDLEEFFIDPVSDDHFLPMRNECTFEVPLRAKALLLISQSLELAKQFREFRRAWAVSSNYCSVIINQIPPFFHRLSDRVEARRIQGIFKGSYVNSTLRMNLSGR
ncbi:hypothetical protein [Candidatus Laterigemmans baculatus]|uniref:hypothetical protein n=1 Tax=Candidatus Laterigemmans baculatus TaxID=2770505 RepID=UPI0013DC26C5|nr:hypothetical protein [Candidatus Laterigemmans baculatus]